VTDPIPRLRRAVRSVRDKLVPDPRIEVFDIRVRRGESRPLVEVETTLPEAEASIQARLRERGLDADLRVAVLPDRSLGDGTEALVRAPVAPVYHRPTMNATQVTQYVLGTRVTLLSSRHPFYRVRGEDAHVGWVHRGYLATGDPEWALAWERADHGEPVVALGADLRDDQDEVVARLPWGARVLQIAGGRFRLPDGRTGRLAGGEVVPVGRLWDRFPARGESVVRTARRWLGAPYLWGGVTPHGVDCSGLVQSAFWIHGIAMPRDSDMQAHVGSPLETGPAFRRLRPGDLLFFAERGRVNHVAISTGGPGIIHASASNGTVALNAMTGELETERHLREIFSGARRLLPD
jgi:gamma-D-glutamyl-L-lysine dipeptidyl-peptidase